MSEDKQDIQLTTMPHGCFSVNLENITMYEIQRVLEKAYLTLLANPTYLFCSEQDKELFVAPTHWHGSSGEMKPIAKLANECTGQYLHIVALPDLEPGTLLFGFFTY